MDNEKNVTSKKAPIGYENTVSLTNSHVAAGAPEGSVSDEYLRYNIKSKTDSNNEQAVEDLIKNSEE